MALLMTYSISALYLRVTMDLLAFGVLNLLRVRALLATIVERKMNAVPKGFSG